MSTKQLIIGLGTGRCGSVSLSRFLNDQPEAFAIHEGAYEDMRVLFPWDGPAETVVDWLHKLAGFAGEQPFLGDTGSYYLPYVEAILAAFPGARFICFERERSGVVRSFAAKTGKRNHWYDHKGKRWKKDSRWDASFPKFDEKDKETAIGLYWDLYHDMASDLAEKYPGHFRIFPMTIINSEAGRGELLDFVGYAGERVLDREYVSNTQKDNRNFRYWLKQKLLFR